MRQNVRNFNGVTLVEDCYNASPDSVRAAVEVLIGMKTGKKAFVFGDMLELGDISEEAHRQVGKLVAEKGIDIFYTYGTMAALAVQEAENCGTGCVKAFDDKLQLANELKAALVPGDTVLFKASRGMKLEEAIKSFTE